MSISNQIKKEIIRKISATEAINKVYAFERKNPQGFPCAFVTVMGVENQFHSTAENMRIFGFRVLLLCQIGQDQNDTDAVERAEEQIQDVLDDIINALDLDITLGDYALVRFVEASVGEFGYVEYEGGWARSAEVMVRVHSEFLVQ